VSGATTFGGLLPMEAHEQVVQQVRELFRRFREKDAVMAEFLKLLEAIAEAMPASTGADFRDMVLVMIEHAFQQGGFAGELASTRVLGSMLLADVTAHNLRNPPKGGAA
jgi:hypothetical protein